MTMKRLILILFAFYALYGFSFERELIWPKGKMPDVQDYQIAAMADEASDETFKADKHRTAYLEWYDAPAEDIRNGGCMILISGGGYNSCVDVNYIKLWRETFTALGFQCVNLVYRTPRPKGLPIYQTAWEDGQRAVRMVRSEAVRRGFDSEKIGTISMSAGSHLALLLATSSQTPAYGRIDELDDVPCHINWAIVNGPAYVTTDGEKGTRATRQGYGPDVKLTACLKFDEKTCPMSLHQGGLDYCSPHGSIMIYRQLRRMHVPAELHLFADQGHLALGLDRAVEFMRQMGFMGPVAPEESLMDRFGSDEARAEYIVEDVWPEGKMPSPQENQCKPYLEWHIPKVLKTKAIQIVYSGGAYMANDPNWIEVAPFRRYMNEKGMTVVTLRYRTPRPAPESGLSKHTTAWQDLQRTIRIVRGEALSRGLDPNRIGIMGGSAGGHLTLMGVTSSAHQSYLGIDSLDNIPCNVQWGIGIYPAYALSDGLDGANENGGNDDDVVLAPEFSFDLNTVPMLFIHGDADDVASMNSVNVWAKMCDMGIQSELHTLALREHCFQFDASPGTGSYTWMDRVWEFMTAKGYNK